MRKQRVFDSFRATLIGEILLGETVYISTTWLGLISHLFLLPLPFFFLLQ